MHDVVFLLDFDNTLLDHDAFKRAMGAWVAENAPHPGEERFWEIYEAIREETGIVDIPETVSRFAFEAGSQALHREMVALTWDFPFSEILLPGALEAVRHLRTQGPTLVLCDGHEAFQRHKLHVTGVADAAGHNILVCVRKEERLDDVRRLFPARRYVMIDDKPRVHIALKRALGDAVTTILVRYGGYSQAAPPGAIPEIDREVRSIRELMAD